MVPIKHVVIVILKQVIRVLGAPSLIDRLIIHNISHIQHLIYLLVCRLGLIVHDLNGACAVEEIDLMLHTLLSHALL